MKFIIVFLGVVYMVLCVALIVIVMMQESKQQGLSGITGDSAEVFSKSKGGMKKEAFLSKMTITLAVFFAVMAIVLSALMRSYQG